ncbi:MAG: hypothetical protein ACKPKO_15175, partial [Candidatus Fonsibacter sp.]
AWPILDALLGAQIVSTACVLCVWAAYKAQVTPQTRKFVVMNANNMQVEVTEERIDADPEMQPELEDLLTRLGDMWVPWAELGGQPSNMAADHLNKTF